MTRYNKRVFEMLVRVSVFWATNKELIPEGSQADQHFQQIEEALNRISEKGTLQTSGKNNVRLSSQERISAREGLRENLESLTRTASSMGLKQFFMPRDRSDRAIADVARIFVQLAEPLKEEFVKQHVPPDFIDRLKGGIAGIERAIQQQAASKGSRKAATAAIAEAQQQALTAVARLDPLMDNLLRDNEPAKAAWVAARRIDKAPSSRKPAQKEGPGNAAPPLPIIPPIPPADRMPA